MDSRCFRCKTQLYRERESECSTLYLIISHASRSELSSSASVFSVSLSLSLCIVLCHFHGHLFCCGSLCLIMSYTCHVFTSQIGYSGSQPCILVLFPCTIRTVSLEEKESYIVLSFGPISVAFIFCGLAHTHHLFSMTKSFFLFLIYHGFLVFNVYQVQVLAPISLFARSNVSL